MTFLKPDQLFLFVSFWWKGVKLLLFYCDIMAFDNWNEYFDWIQVWILLPNILLQNFKDAQKTLSDVPPHPWHTLGSDLFYYKKQDSLAFEYFSKFLVRKLPNSTSQTVIKELSLSMANLTFPVRQWYIRRIPIFHEKLEYWAQDNLITFFSKQ